MKLLMSCGEWLQEMPPFLQLLNMGCHYSLDWTTGLDYWTGLLDWTTGLEFFPFLDKLSIWFLKIFDTWRS